MTGRGLRTLGLLVTRAVLLVALCGLALSLVGSMSVHQRQYFGAAECGDDLALGVVEATPRDDGADRIGSRGLLGA